MKKYIPFLITLLLFIFLLTLFLWKEKFNISVALNSEKFGQFGTILGSLLTALTVYLLYRQISEMIADRKAANQPDLYPTETRFATEDLQNTNFLSPEANLPVPTFYRMVNNLKEEEQTSNIKLYNIGLGAAKEVKIEWLYEDKIKEFLNGVYDSQNNSNREELLDFVPAQNFSEISLPYLFMKTSGTRLNADVLDALDNNPKTKPDLFLKLHFKDIYDNSHDRKFKVDLNCFQNDIHVKFKRT